MIAKVKLLQVVLAATFVVVGFGSKARSQGEWKLFRSSLGFSVLYPPTWPQLAHDATRLNLISSERKANTEGVVIAPGQAQLSAYEDPGSGPMTADEYLRKLVGDDLLLSSKVVPNQSITGGGGRCSQFEDIVIKIRVGPASYKVLAAFVCVSGKNQLIVSEINWENDANQESYQEVARRVAERIRAGGGPE